MMNRLHWLGDIPVIALPVVFFLLLLAAESLLPLRRRSASRLHRWAVNLVLTAMVFAAGAWLLTPVVNALTGKVQSTRCGLLCWMGLPSGVAAVAGFLLMDLSFYWWHRVNHEVKLLWRFHAVHHADPDVDVTTSFRFHLGEIILSVVFRVAQVLLIGIMPAVYALYELFFTLATIFQHSNLRLPLYLERPLNLLIVTPRMHGIHHSAWRDETNSNYSVIFRLWDTLHRTIRLNVPQDAVEIGVPCFDSKRDNSLSTLVKMPFGPMRDYWQKRGVPRLSRDFPSTGGVDRLAG